MPTPSARKKDRKALLKRVDKLRDQVTRPAMNLHDFATPSSDEILVGRIGAAAEGLIPALHERERGGACPPGLRDTLMALEARSDDQQLRKTVMYLHHVLNLRNWVSHGSREVTSEDATEALRMFCEILEWWTRRESAPTRRLEVTLEFGETCEMATPEGDKLLVPPSVRELRTRLESSYREQDWRKFAQCFSPQYEGYLYDARTRGDLVRELKEANRKTPFRLDLILRDPVLAPDSVLWWRVESKVLSGGGSHASFEDPLVARLVGLQKKCALVQALKRRRDVSPRTLQRQGGNAPSAASTSSDP